MLHLVVSAAISTVSGVVVSLDAVSVSTILAVSTMTVVAGTSVGSNIVVCVPVMDSIVSRPCTMVGSNGVVSGLLVISVCLFVTSTLILGVCSNVAVLSVFRSVGTMSIVSTVATNVVVSVSGVSSITVASMVSIMGLSVSTVSVALSTVSAVCVSG